MNYLSIMTEQQVLVMYSGHPLGLFPTLSKVSPRVVITNGLVRNKDRSCSSNYFSFRSYRIIRRSTITNVSLHLVARCKFLKKSKNKKKLSSSYGQMTAGSYCYIGPQGIVHGTYVNFSKLSLTHLRRT